jgi:DNA-binding NarL/FixJ family response regulator
VKTVFIVDDHTAIREGFKAILIRSGRFGDGGEAASAEEALERLRAISAGKEPRGFPDLIIVDISLPGMSGLDFASALKKLDTVPPIVVLSMHRRFDYIAGAFRAGASAYVAKDAGAECIIAALDAAVSGGYYLDPASLKLFVDEASGGRRSAASDALGLSALSDREAEVMKLLAAGKRAEEIADILSLSQKTVENHLSNITGKLGVRDRFELYRLAARLEDA